MKVLVLTLVFTSLLREGMPLFTDLLISPGGMTWNEAGSYCQENNGRLIVLDSQAKWDDLTAHVKYPAYSTNNECWTGMRFNDTITCRYGEYRNPWNYNGWGNWNHLTNEPNDCPTKRCIRLQFNRMRTSNCEKSHTALCEIGSSAPNLSTAIKTTTSEPTTALTAESAGVQPVVSSTTPVTPDVHVSSTTVPTTTPTTEAADNESAVSSTTLNTPNNSTEAAGVESTTLNTPDADTSSTVSSMAPNTPEADATSSDPNTTDATGNDATTATPIPSGEGNVTCNQCCVKAANQTRQLDEHEREEILHALRIQLAVNKTNLSAQRRKLISVYDSGPSSVAIGSLACGVLAAIVGVIVVPDSINLGRFVYKRFQNQHKTLPI